RRRHTRFDCDWSSDVCSSDLAITNGADVTRTIYDPAIAETTPFSGVEYALSAFDAQWSTNLFYQKNDHQQNVRANGIVNAFFVRSEERRIGKECKYRWSEHH